MSWTCRNELNFVLFGRKKLYKIMILLCRFNSLLFLYLNLKLFLIYFNNDVIDVMSFFVLIWFFFFLGWKVERRSSFCDADHPEQLLRQLQAGGHRHPEAGLHAQQWPGRQSSGLAHHVQSLWYIFYINNNSIWLLVNTPTFFVLAVALLKCIP